MCIRNESVIVNTLMIKCTLDGVLAVFAERVYMLLASTSFVAT